MKNLRKSSLAAVLCVVFVCGSTQAETPESCPFPGNSGNRGWSASVDRYGTLHVNGSVQTPNPSINVDLVLGEQQCRSGRVLTLNLVAKRRTDSPIVLQAFVWKDVRYTARRSSDYDRVEIRHGGRTVLTLRVARTR